MDSLSRPSHRRKHSTSAAAKVLSSSFSFKSPYGDVLLSNGGERKSLQAHEYSEVFSGSSSIPVLDLSGLDERLASGDSRSSKLDYTNIFGGLTHDEVFVPYEELLKVSAKKPKTRIPAEERPYLQESVSQLSSRKTERPPRVAPNRSVDGVKLQEPGSLPSTVKAVRPSGVASDQSICGVNLQESDSAHPSRKTEEPPGVVSDRSVDGAEQHLSMTFSRTNQINTDATDAEIHTGKLHAVPGFTHFLDGNQSYKGKNDRPPSLKREVSRTWSFSAEVEPPNSKGGLSFDKSRVVDKSDSVNEVNIPHESIPSFYPPNPSDVKGPRRSKASDFTAQGDVSQKITCESSEEFDYNSVDAVSAATLKKAIEEAQESIRIAKMIMGKKKDGYQEGSKSRPNFSSLKVADRETKIEAFGSKGDSARNRYEEMEPVFSVPAGSDGKSTPSLSHGGTHIDVRENVETDGTHGETFAGEFKLFASNNIQSETTNVAENVGVENLEKKVEEAEEQIEAKKIPGCGAFDLEPAEVCNINSLISPTNELASNIGRMGKETFEWRNVTANHTEGSEVVPEISASQQTLGMEKNLESDKLCHARFYQAEDGEGPEDNKGRVLNSSLRISENCKVIYEASEILRVDPEGGVNEQRENDGNGEEHEKKLEECDELVDAMPEFNDMLNASCNLVGNENLEQEEMEKTTESVSKWERNEQRHAETSDEEMRGRRKEGHLCCEKKESLKELLLEVFNMGKIDVLPEVGEFANKIGEVKEPQINDSKQNCADNGDRPKSPEELVQNQVEDEHVKTTNYEATGTTVMGASHVQKMETYSEAEKIGNALSDAGRGDSCHNASQFEGAAYEENTDEAVNLSRSEADIIFDVAHTNETSNTITETQEPCRDESNSKGEDQKSIKRSEENMPKSNEAVSAVDKDKMAERLFNLQDDEMLRTNHLHRSASEEIFLENKLQYTYEGLPSNCRTEAFDVLDTDPEDNLSEDGNVAQTTNDIQADSQECASEINIQDMPDVLGSHIGTADPPDFEQVLEQTTEGDEGFLSVSSSEKTQESEDSAGNVEDTTSNKEELRDEMISDECAAELSEGAVDADVDIEKDKENCAGMPPMEECDAKEGIQNFESDDHKQRIEAIKRERDREKDRIAVERAIREARERAFAEVRERAERAAVERAATEVRQRATADGRDKVEKASVVKQPVDKACSEAKLRAERAAVERATAEARERALEKARSQKTSEEWRTPADRHSTEKSSSSRNNVLKHSFSSSDLETGVNSESAQRRKARLERHQRIMERAAKALAEKNMRDLLAQKEQAERNRFAESLDADIRRWASGKEGNLRALLSTLQYILGPDSGWQPISLTEIITTAAVKKAYRKATLCVHPDKLQQRGASVQQKYICEKVFDLLKAAWNRFNSDER